MFTVRIRQGFRRLAILYTLLLCIVSCKVDMGSENGFFTYDLDSVLKGQLATELVVFSTSTINELLRSRGVSEVQFSYSSSPSVRLRNTPARLLVYCSLTKNSYSINGNIAKRIPVIPSGYNIFTNDTFEPIAVYGRLGFEVFPCQDMSLYNNEVRPILSKCDKFLGRVMIDVDWRGSFTVIDLSSCQEIISGDGRLIYLESTETTLHCLVRSIGEKRFRLLSYNLHDLNDEPITSEIPYPNDLRDGWVYGFEDIDLKQNRIAFLEYNVPGSLLHSPRMWIFDLGSLSFVRSVSLKRQGGHIFVRFLR
jgi:hypothetical protein